jgi:hypothetical protein
MISFFIIKEELKNLSVANKILKKKGKILLENLGIFLEKGIDS